MSATQYTLLTIHLVSGSSLTLFISSKEFEFDSSIMTLIQILVGLKFSLAWIESSTPMYQCLDIKSKALDIDKVEMIYKYFVLSSNS